MLKSLDEAPALADRIAAEHLDHIFGEVRQWLPGLIGRVIEDPVELYPVDGYEDYSYTVVNERRVIVDPQTRQIIQIIE